MRSAQFLFVGMVVGAFALAGCIEDGPATDLADDLLDENAVPALAVKSTGCREGGGISMYNTEEGSYLIEPYFEYHDIEDDMGYPMILSYGTPNLPDQIAMGIHHVSVICDGHTVNGEDGGRLEWGWVGQRVKAPPWDTSGIERQYFIADISFSNPSIVTGLQERTGLHVSDNCGSVLDYVQNTNLLHQILCDAEHGEFEVWQLQKDYRALSERQNVMRFWFHVEVGGGHGHDDMGRAGGADAVMYQPVSIDVIDTPHEDGKWRVIDNVRLLMHVFGVEEGQPGSHQGIFGGSLYWGNFDREIRIGQVPDLLVEESWFH